MPEKKNTIGRFEILEKIGEGPIGAVYKALDPVIRRTVAIKVIKLYALEETTTFAEVFEKIYRVVRTSTSLNHPNICIIYDLSEEKKIPYITMEYVEGQDLESLLQKNHQFKRSALLNVLIQICDALDFAHKKNVIHQDLKTTNILLTPELQVKITDFGIAGLDEIAAAQTKKLLSIPYYISPEQALGEKVTAASDLFSLGVIIHHLISGELPFRGTTAANVIMTIARDHPAVPIELNKSGIRKDDWNAFFGTALAKSPDHRFRSAREMYNALEEMLPPSEQSYYPYGVAVMAENTGRFEKEFVNESISPPTLMIDPSKLFEGQHNQENIQAAETLPPIQLPKTETTAPVTFPPAPAGSSAYASPQESSLPETLIFRGEEQTIPPAAAPTLPPELSQTISPDAAPTAMLPIPQIEHHIPKPPDESYDTNPRMIPELLDGTPTSVPTRLLELPGEMEAPMPELMEEAVHAEPSHKESAAEPVEQSQTESLTQAPTLPPWEMVEEPVRPPELMKTVMAMNPEAPEEAFSEMAGLSSTVVTQSEFPAPEDMDEAPPTMTVPAPQAAETIFAPISEPPATVIPEPIAAATIISTAEEIPEPPPTQPPAAATVIATVPDIPPPPLEPTPAAATVLTPKPNMPPPVESAPAAATVITSMPNMPPPVEPASIAATVITPKPNIPPPVEPASIAATVITPKPNIPPPVEPTPAAATVITTMPNMAAPPVEPAPAAATVITTRPEVPPAPPQPPPAAATIISTPFEAPPATMRVSTPPPPAAPVQGAAPTVMMTSPPVSKPVEAQRAQIPVSKIVGPPNLKRYLIGALAVALLVSIAGAIFFFWPEKKGPDIQPATTTTPSAVTTTTITPAPNPSQGTTTGRLSITTEPAGAKVFLQGEEKGVTPLELSDLPVGKYALKLQMDGFKDVDKEVEVTAENSAASLPVTLEKTAPLVGTLVVESDPPNAFIVIGNRVLGVTPKKLPNTKAGKYNITLKKDGYQDFTGTVRVVQDKSITFTGQLVEIQKPTPVVEQPVVKKSEVVPGTLVTLGPDVTPPKSIKKTYGKYPPSARERHVQGTVQMSILVSETGKVLDVKLVKSAHPILDEVSLAAVRDWIFEPATKEGVPVRVWIPVSMTYQFK